MCQVAGDQGFLDEEKLLTATDQGRHAQPAPLRRSADPVMRSAVRWRCSACPRAAACSVASAPVLQRVPLASSCPALSKSPRKLSHDAARPRVKSSATRSLDVAGGPAWPSAATSCRARAVVSHRAPLHHHFQVGLFFWLAGRGRNPRACYKRGTPEKEAHKRHLKRFVEVSRCREAIRFWRVHVAG